MKAVRAVFRGYTERLEGRTRNPYADVKGLVTVAFGCLIDPLPNALALDWRIGDRAATPAEVEADWRAVKAIGKSNRTAASQAPLTRIRLSDAAVERLLWSRLDANVAWLVKHSMPQLETFPADAQLAICSAAWALGCDFKHTDPPRPELVDACNARDWKAAKSYAQLNEHGNAGVIDRNRAQVLCFDNAAAVDSQRLQRDLLWWPLTVPPAKAPPPDPVTGFVKQAFNGLLEDPSLGGAQAMREHDEKSGGES